MKSGRVSIRRANMIHCVAKYARAAATTLPVRSSSVRYSIPLRSIHGEISVPNANHVAIQMVNYALSHARSHKSGESYAQGILVLEQCLGNQPHDDSSSKRELLCSKSQPPA